MASASVDFCQKTRTVQQPQPNDANPNTAESMVKTRTVLALTDRVKRKDYKPPNNQIDLQHLLVI
jgi:hypothetical protein